MTFSAPFPSYLSLRPAVMNRKGSRVVHSERREFGAKLLQSYDDKRIHADHDKRERSRVELNAKTCLERAARPDVTWVCITAEETRQYRAPTRTRTQDELEPAFGRWYSSRLDRLNAALPRETDSRAPVRTGSTRMCASIAVVEYGPGIHGEQSESAVESRERAVRRALRAARACLKRSGTRDRRTRCRRR
jgi:hypothetical protein